MPNMPNGRTKIVLLGGTHGVGKTTVGHHLGIELSIMQRTGLGAIIKAIRTVAPENNVFSWDQCDIGDREQVRENLRRQSELIGRVITTVVDAAISTGEDYIIEGVQLMPEFLPLNRIQLFYLTCPDEEMQRKRYEQPTVTRVSHGSVKSYGLVSTVRSLLLEEGNKFGVPVIDNSSPPEITAKLIGERIRYGYGPGADSTTLARQ